MNVEVCIKCLARIQGATGVMIDIDGQSWWCCRDQARCAARQSDNKARHQREIDHRIRAGRGRFTHLIVVQDTFGARYGYSDVFFDVRPGELPEDVLAAELSSRGWTMENLVYEVIAIDCEPQL